MGWAPTLCRLAAVQIAVLCPELARAARVKLQNNLQQGPAPDGAADSARQALVQSLKDDGVDHLVAIRDFSGKIFKIARDAWTELSADLPPHALLIAGSGGRYEMATYSDLEFLIAFESSCPLEQEQEKLLRTKITSFRKLLKARHDIQVDSINIPTSRKKTLACSPSKLVQDILSREDAVSTSMVLETSFLAGDEEVATEVRDIVQHWMGLSLEEAKQQGLKLKSSGGKGLVRQFFLDRLEAWRFGAKLQRARAQAGQRLLNLQYFNVKEVLYRPLQVVVSVYAFASHKPTNGEFAFNTASVLDWFQATGKWPADVCIEIRKALQAALRARALAQAEMKGENDVMAFQPPGDMYFGDPPFVVPENLHNDLENAAEVVVKLLDAHSDTGPWAGKVSAK